MGQARGPRGRHRAGIGGTCGVSLPVLGRLLLRLLAGHHPGELRGRCVLSGLWVRSGNALTAGDRMRTVMHLAAHELRARWRAWAVLVALVAVVGGAVLAAVAGALRTGSAYPRLLTASKASDVLVAPDGSGLGGYFGALARLPGVAAVARVAGLSLEPLGHGAFAATSSNAMAPVD